MSFLPQNTILGTLNMLEIYVFYDRPVLFTCKNTVGTIYLVVLADEDDDAETWFFVSMSESRFAHVRSGGIDLYAAFRDSEDGYLLEVRTPADGSQAQVLFRNNVEISDDRLPTPGEVLNLPTETLPKLSADLPQKALQTHREVLKLKLEFPDRQRTEAPAKALGKILQTTQDVINELGKQLSPLYRNGNLTQGLQGIMSLAVSDLGPGSFDVELISSRPPSFFGEKLLSDALTELVALLNLGNDETLLKERLTILQKAVTLNYFKFLQAVRDSTADITEITWASPMSAQNGRAKLTSPTIFQIIEILNNWTEVETKEFDITVELEGLLLNAKRFEVALSDETVYRGSISSDIDLDTWEKMRSATLSRRYRARIRQVTTSKMSAEYPSIKNILLRLDPA